MSMNVLMQGKLNTDRTKPQEIYADANGSLQVSQVSSTGVAQEYIGTVPTVYEQGGAGVGQSFNREASAAQITTLTTSAVIRFRWPAGSRPTLAQIKPIGGAVWVCFDAPDPATALVWCQGASDEEVDSQRFLVAEYLPEQDAVSGASVSGREFPFTAGLSNVYILEYATAVTALIVEAS